MIGVARGVEYRLPENLFYHTGTTILLGGREKARHRFQGNEEGWRTPSHAMRRGVDGRSTLLRRVRCGGVVAQRLREGRRVSARAIPQRCSALLVRRLCEYLPERCGSERRYGRRAVARRFFVRETIECRYMQQRVSPYERHAYVDANPRRAFCLRRDVDEELRSREMVATPSSQARKALRCFSRHA